MRLTKSSIIQNTFTWEQFQRLGLVWHSTNLIVFGLAWHSTNLIVCGYRSAPVLQDSFQYKYWFKPIHIKNKIFMSKHYTWRSKHSFYVIQTRETKKLVLNLAHPCSWEKFIRNYSTNLIASFVVLVYSCKCIKKYYIYLNYICDVYLSYKF